MPNKPNRLKTKSKSRRAALTRRWQAQLADYVTAIAWCPDGKRWAASSAAGEVVLYDHGGGATFLRTAQGDSVDALAVSADGQWLAAGGQAGTVWIWSLAKTVPETDAIAALAHPRTWIDCLHWHPQQPLLAYSSGRTAQVWHAADRTTATLDFETSSVLGLAWHPQGQQLSLSGNQSVKTWQLSAWHEAPDVWNVGGASEAIAWSPEGTYLASGNNDRSVMVWQQNNPYPWQMQGFPGKVRQLAWSRPVGGAPLLATVSGIGAVVWQKATDSGAGWTPQVLAPHRGAVRGVAFQPGALLLATAAEDGCVHLWHNATQLAQVLTGAPAGFSCLAWSPQGHSLAAGGSQGDLIVWDETSSGRGFG